MNKSKQLTQLILSFYRENTQSLQQLQLLIECQLFRRWRVFYIRCGNQATADAITAAYPILREPIAQLRLAKKIAILVGRIEVAVFPVGENQIRAQEHPASRQEKTDPPLA